MLEIAVLCLIKLSILAFIHSLTNIHWHRQLVTALGVLILLWAISAELAIGFLCGLPAPWNYISKTCFGRRQTFWRYFAAMNIITDVAQILTIMWIVAYLQTPRKRRMTLCMVFGVRTL